MKSNSVIFVSGKHVVKTVPQSQEREANEQSKRAAEFSYEGDNRIYPGLLLRPDVRRHEVVAEHEVVLAVLGLHDGGGRAALWLSCSLVLLETES